MKRFSHIRRNIKKSFRLLLFFSFMFVLLSCAVLFISNSLTDTNEIPDHLILFNAELRTVFSNLQLPAEITSGIRRDATLQGNFFNSLFIILNQDPYLYILVDKQHALTSDYSPNDLVVLESNNYRSRIGNLLRSMAADSLEEMAVAARRDGVTLTATSTYRSYSYQVTVYERTVREMGREEADEVSAHPGHSQHQLGLAIDFGNIDESFALTDESAWLQANASRFGWSLSYPLGYEHITGYNWEIWHYRYVGRELSAFIDRYFNGIQQYALLFIREWIEIVENAILE